MAAAACGAPRCRRVRRGVYGSGPNLAQERWRRSGPSKRPRELATYPPRQIKSVIAATADLRTASGRLSAQKVAKAFGLSLAEHSALQCGLRLRPSLAAYARPNWADRLEALSLRRLSREEEGLRVLSLAADLERTEVPVPEPVGSLWLGFSPQLQLIEVLGGNLALAKPLEQMVPEGVEASRSTGSSASITEGHAG